jgi:hypothetical protein
MFRYQIKEVQVLTASSLCLRFNDAEASAAAGAAGTAGTIVLDEADADDDVDNCINLSVPASCDLPPSLPLAAVLSFSGCC